MSMDIKIWKEILEPVNNYKSLDASNLIEKIRKKFEIKMDEKDNNWTLLKKESKKWNNQNNNINLIFEVTGLNTYTVKYTLLHLAAHLCLESVVRSLLKVEEIDVNAKGSKKRTPLHIAAEKGNENITKALIGAKANVDVKDTDSKTPLDLTMNQDIEELLIAAANETADDVGDISNECFQINRDLNDSGYDGSSISHSSSLGDVSTISNKDQNDEITFGLVIEPEENSTMFSNDSGIGPELLQTENNNTTQNSSVTNEQQNKLSEIMEGGSLLHFHALHGLNKGLKCLLKTRIFDVNQRDKNGRTPLHIAARNNQPEIVSLLREYGASVDVEDNDGKKPLDLATDLFTQNALKADNSQYWLWDNTDGTQSLEEEKYNKLNVILHNQTPLGELYTIIPPEENLDSSGYERNTSSVTFEIDSNSGDRDDVSDKEELTVNYDEGDSAIFTTDSLCDIEEQSDEEAELQFDTPPSDSSTENSAGAVELPAGGNPMFVKEQPNTKEQDSQFQNNTTVNQLVTGTVAVDVDSNSGDGNLSKEEKKKESAREFDTSLVSTENIASENSAVAELPSGDSHKLAIKKAIFVTCSTVVLSATAACALFVTGIVAVNLVSILSAVAIVATATFVAGYITYEMSKPPSTKMKVVDDYGIHSAEWTRNNSK